MTTSYCLHDPLVLLPSTTMVFTVQLQYYTPPTIYIYRPSSGYCCDTPQRWGHLRPKFQRPFRVNLVHKHLDDIQTIIGVLWSLLSNIHTATIAECEKVPDLSSEAIVVYCSCNVYPEFLWILTRRWITWDLWITTAVTLHASYYILSKYGIRQKFNRSQPFLQL